MTSTAPQASASPTRTATPKKKPNYWWMSVCAGLSICLLAVMYQFFWQFIPKQEKTDFYEEVQMLLDLQREIKDKTGEVATMDSIRDVVFGNNIVAGGVRKRAEQLVADAGNDETQKQYAVIIQKGLLRWDESSEATRMDRLIFIFCFFVTGLGFPLGLWWFGRPGIENLLQKLKAKQAVKAEVSRKKREAAMARAKQKMSSAAQKAKASP
jgi:hypothetical protein